MTTAWLVVSTPLQWKWRYCDWLLRWPQFDLLYRHIWVISTLQWKFFSLQSSICHLRKVKPKPYIGGEHNLLPYDLFSGHNRRVSVVLWKDKWLAVRGVVSTRRKRGMEDKCLCVFRGPVPFVVRSVCWIWAFVIPSRRVGIVVFM